MSFGIKKKFCICHENRIEMSEDEISRLSSLRMPFDFVLPRFLIKGTDLESSRVEERINSLTGTSLSNELKYNEQAFDEKIEKIFNLAEKIYTDSAKAKIPAVLDYVGTVIEASCKFVSPLI
ncbi:mannosyl-oligosaccharide glucosidase [Trifolium repens]|nr:mannosyl-oligosaccharide glucosidase [Trifolium repens]